MKSLNGLRKADGIWPAKSLSINAFEHFRRCLLRAKEQAEQITTSTHPEFSSSLFSNVGDGLYQLGRYEDVIASFDKALEFKPDYHEAWNNRGTALGNLERLEDALASYDKAIEFKPDYYKAWNNRGTALDDLERFEEAIASYDKALEIKSDYPDPCEYARISVESLRSLWRGTG